MAQHDMVLDNGPGLAVRTDMNAAVAALVSNNSGPVEPTTKYPGMFWLDTSVTPNGLLKQRNLANTDWISVTISSGTPGEEIHAAPNKTVPADADEFPLSDSASTPTPWQRAKMTFANLKAAIVTGLGTIVHAGAQKATLVDLDEFSIGDSVSTPNPWAVRRHTWANLKTMIGINTDQRLVEIMIGSVLDVDTLNKSGWFYAGLASTNVPPAIAGQGGFVFVLQLNNALITRQTFYATQSGRVFTRWRHSAVASGAWQAWQELGLDALLKTGQNTINYGGYLAAAYAGGDAPASGQYRPSPFGGAAGVGTHANVGNMRVLSAPATAWTFNAPNDASDGTTAFSMVIAINNAATYVAPTFAGFNKVNGAMSTTASGWTMAYITKIGAIKTIFLEALI